MISVVVPVYKSEKTLEKCVNSLCAQTDRDLEILLVVDGPPDGSGILADELAKKDERIRVINQVNQGVSRARNRGIKEAKGEYIRFVDSDDYVDEERKRPRCNEEIYSSRTCNFRMRIHGIRCLLCTRLYTLYECSG